MIDTLRSQFAEAAAYLFYDMGFATLAPPLVIDASELEDERDEHKTSASFSFSGDRVFSGLPLSLWLFTRLAREETGISVRSFRAAMDAFVERLGRYHGGAVVAQF